MTPQELAHAISVPLITVNHWELGYSVPDLNELKRLISYSGFSADELLLGKRVELIDISNLSYHQKRIIKAVYQSFLDMNRKETAEDDGR